MVRRLAVAPLSFLLLSVVLVRPAFATTVSIPAGASIQAAISDNQPGTTFQLDAGTWLIGATIKPKAGDRFVGAGIGQTILDGTTQTFNGFAGPSKVINVEIAFLTVRGFLGGVQTGSGWFVHGIEATGDQVGVRMNGTGPVVSDSQIHDNTQYGVSGSTSNGQFLRNDVSYNRTNTAFSPGSSGATKWSNSTGLLVDGNSVHDNFGRGLWLDGQDHTCTFSNNVVQNNLDDGIRVEIGYDNVVAGNQVAGNGGSAITVVNSSGTVVRSNTISAPALQPYVLRFFGSGRLNGSGVEYTNTNNRAESNSITLVIGQFVGVMRTAGTTSGNTYDLNTYQVPSLTSSYFKWWDGSVQRTLAWSGWQGFGQDLNGTIALSPL